MDPKLKAELTSWSKWKRLLLIAVYAIMFRIAEALLAVVVVVQSLLGLFTGTPNASLRDFGHRLGHWLREAVDYGTWASDAPPWPFGNPWPRPPRLPRGPESDADTE